MKEPSDLEEMMSATKKAMHLIACATLTTALIPMSNAAAGSAPTRQATLNGEHPGVFTAMLTEKAPRR